MKNLFILVGLGIVLSSFYKENTLKGTWEFRGGIYKGKPEAAPKDYLLQRNYTDQQYDAYVIEPGQKAQRYESGKYRLKGDTCYETQTYSAQPSKIKNVTVHYVYTISHDTLYLAAKLPGGTFEVDYWKKVK